MQVKVSMISCRLSGTRVTYYGGGTCELRIVELVCDAFDSVSNIAVLFLFFDFICSRGTYVFVYFD